MAANTERPLDRARLVRAVLHALWLRGLRAPGSWRYAVGVVAALVPSLLRSAMNPYWGPSFPYIFYFPATLFTALFSGLGPAWVGIGILAVLTWVWILPLTGSLVVANPIDLVGLAVFIVSDGIIAWIGASYRALIEQSERQSAELAARKQEADAANRAKDDFLAVLSHELRTPLTTLVAGVRVLRQFGSSEEGASRAREAIERQADHLKRLVDDLLDMKIVVTGVVALEHQPCDLADVVAGLIDTLNAADHFKDHALSVDAETVWVNGDAVRLQQIVANLLGNAVKYTPAGGSIHVSVKREGDDAVIRVQDTGIGIATDLLPRMFELFVQGDPGSGRVRSGLGIGLAVVHRLAELHGGTVQASSDGPGRGSTFTVRLPRAPAPSA
ncbi:MAG TPA: HAMP domain-containing sensor histidine kinase [Methylomirabilota bacterium]|nr:HAMP domain-containing sensor histidine kinase [Methylomirabilota bacterium]